jgi:hypothetical protein
MPPPPNQVALARKYGQQYGVDPRLLLAIGGHETQWGTTGAGRPSQGGYTLGYGVTDTKTLSKYAGVANQYKFAAKTLMGWGVRSIRDVLAGKAGSYATDPHWEKGVAGVYKNLGGSLPAGSFSTQSQSQTSPQAPPRPPPQGPQVAMTPYVMPMPPSIMPFISGITSAMRNRDGGNVLGALAGLRSTGDQYVNDLLTSSTQYGSDMRARIAAARQTTAQSMGTPPVQPVTAPQGGATNSPSGPQMAPIKGSLAEAFYDPIGQWDNGRFSKQGIGNHSDHVHFSVINPQAMIQAIHQAQSMGLRVGENPYVDKVDPVHVKDSFHYRNFPGSYGGKPLGEAIDVSGDPRQMAAFFRWGLANLR